MLICATALAQPTPHEQRYIFSWNGTSIRERADMKSKQIAHLNYGDSVTIYPQQSPKDTVNISIYERHSIVKNRIKTIFPGWNDAADWIPVVSSKGSGFAPSVFLSDKPPLLFDSATERAREGIDEYFFRTRGLLEGKPIHRKIKDVRRYYQRSVFPLYDVNRSVYAGGVMFEWRYAASDHDNFLLFLPNWSLVEAYHFLNVLFNLEPEQRSGFGESIRLVKREENLLIFSNKYTGGGKKGERRKQFTIHRINETIIITKEELIVND